MLKAGDTFVDLDIRYAGRTLKVVSVAMKHEWYGQRDTVFCMAYGVGGGKGLAMDLARLTDPTRFRRQGE